MIMRLSGCTDQCTIEMKRLVIDDNIMKILLFEKYVNDNQLIVVVNHS